MCVQGFSRIKLGINLPASCFIQFLFLWQKLYSSTYFFTSFVIPDHQKFLVTSSTVFYCPSCPSTGVSWYSLIISILNTLSLGTYTFPSLYIIPSTSLHSSSLNIFTPARFISSTAFITSSSFTLDCFTFSSRSTSSMITFTSSVLCTSSYSSLTFTWWVIASALLFVLSTFLITIGLFSFCSLNPCFAAIFQSINISVVPLSKSAFTNTPLYISTFFTPTFNYTSLSILNILLISLCSSLSQTSFGP